MGQLANGLPWLSACMRSMSTCSLTKIHGYREKRYLYNPQT